VVPARRRDGQLELEEEHTQLSSSSWRCQRDGDLELEVLVRRQDGELELEVPARQRDGNLEIGEAHTQLSSLSWSCQRDGETASWSSRSLCETMLELEEAHRAISSGWSCGRDG
jgi:hypothetical protein